MIYTIKEDERYVSYQLLDGTFRIHREVDILTSIDIEINEKTKEINNRLKEVGFISEENSNSVFSIDTYLRDYKTPNNVLSNKFYIISFKENKGIFSRKGDYDISVTISQPSDYTATFDITSYLKHGKILIDHSSVSGYNNKKDAEILSTLLTERLFLTIKNNDMQLNCDDASEMKNYFEEQFKIEKEKIKQAELDKQEKIKKEKEKIKEDMNTNPSYYIEALREENKNLRADLNALSSNLYLFTRVLSGDQQALATLKLKSMLNDAFANSTKID